MKVKIDTGAFVPERAHSTDAGLDLRAMETKTIPSYGYASFKTGIHVEIPAGYVGLITSKSGLMAKGITCRGTIDSGYTGEIRAVMFNQSAEHYLVKKGDKITQLVVMPCLLESVELVSELAETERGSGGFGSTGR